MNVFYFYFFDCFLKCVDYFFVVRFESKKVFFVFRERFVFGFIFCFEWLFVVFDCVFILIYYCCFFRFIFVCCCVVVFEFYVFVL